MVYVFTCNSFKQLNNGLLISTAQVNPLERRRDSIINLWSILFTKTVRKEDCKRRNQGKLYLQCMSRLCTMYIRIQLCNE